MKALRSFAVRAALPEPVSALAAIAINLRWAWDTRTADLFRWVDAEAWEGARHDPVRMLGMVSQERYGELTNDEAFIAFLSSVESDLQEYLSKPRWYQHRKGKGAPASIAYLSPEFGVGEALPVYSGGLGVLAGDHLKAASDLGVPLVAVGLLYREGYFRQRLNQDGWQQERYPKLDPHGMPLRLVFANGGSLKVEVDLAGARCVAQIWRAEVGRIPLLLLDCDVEDNEPEERAVTDRLYGGDASIASGKRSFSGSAAYAPSKPQASSPTSSTPMRVTPGSWAWSASVNSSQIADWILPLHWRPSGRGPSSPRTLPFPQGSTFTTPV